MPVAHNLYLLRHAKSSWDHAGVADHDRPLAPRGQRAAREMGEHLRASKAAPSLVLCSTALRARETLAALALGRDVTYEEGLYGAAADELLARLRGLPERARSVMLVGHNPGLGELASLLVGKGEPALLARLREKLPTGALVELSFQGTWASLGPGSGSLEAFVVPREL